MQQNTRKINLLAKLIRFLFIIIENSKSEKAHWFAK